MTFLLKNVAKTRGDDLIIRSHIRLVLPVLLLALGMTTVSHAQVVLLGSGYDITSFGDVAVSNGNMTTRLAAGGSIEVSSVSIHSLPGDSLPVLYSEAEIDIKKSSIAGGDLLYTTEIDIKNSSISPGYSAHQTGGALQSPFSTSSVRQHFQTLSTNLSNLQQTGSSNFAYGTLTLTGSDAFNVFNVTLGDYKNLNQILIAANTSATIIVNVYGQNIRKFATNLSGATATNVLFNFVDTTSITLNNNSFQGTFLAPYATITGTGNSISGQLIAGDITLRNFSFSGHSFTGNIPVSAIPEPGMYALLFGLASLGFMGFQRRRRRRKTLLAKTKAGATAR